MGDLQTLPASSRAEVKRGGCRSPYTLIPGLRLYLWGTVSVCMGGGVCHWLQQKGADPPMHTDTETLGGIPIWSGDEK